MDTDGLVLVHCSAPLHDERGKVAPPSVSSLEGALYHPNHADNGALVL